MCVVYYVLGRFERSCTHRSVCTHSAKASHAYRCVRQTISLSDSTVPADNAVHAHKINIGMSGPLNPSRYTQAPRLLRHVYGLVCRASTRRLAKEIKSIRQLNLTHESILYACLTASAIFCHCACLVYRLSRLPDASTQRLAAGAPQRAPHSRARSLPRRG